MQSNDIEALLLKFTTNSLTAEERRQLVSLLQQQPQEQAVTDVLQNLMLKENATDHFDEERFLPILKRLLNADKPAPAPVTGITRKLPYLRYAAAAVAIAAITTALVLFFEKNNKYDQPNQPLAGKTGQPFSPNMNRAVLKLPDGREIYLDSAQGSILEQDQFRVTNDSGKLDYAGNTEKIGFHTLSTPRGSQYQLRLPDGSQVWLNTGSSITYPTSFKGRNRNVTITGEAYFEVAKNKAMPFIVNVQDKARVEVLGTHFNIKSYADETAIKTTLLEGKVKVTAAQASNRPIILNPGEQAQIKQAQIKVVNDIDPELEVAWKGGFFDFREADLQTVMRELSRWYNVEVQFDGPPATDQFEGRIPMNAPLDEVLKLLEKNDVRFRLEGKKLIVSTGQNK